FAVGMAIVLAAVGFIIDARVGSALLGSVDQNLRVQAEEIATHADRPRTPDRDRADAPQVAQILRADGSVAESTPSGLPPSLSRAQIRAVSAGARRWHSGSIRGLDGNWRTLAVPSNVGGHAGVAVIGRSLEQRDEALDRLVDEFLIGGPAVLLLAILAGYGVAAAALRPVEAMRRRAAAITASTAGRRLPVPPTRDELALLAETLNDMLTRLEAALEHERRFVDDASHELRTPLALLKTELELALRHPRSRDELEQTLRSAAEDTDRLVRRRCHADENREECPRERAETECSGYGRVGDQEPDEDDCERRDQERPARPAVEEGHPAGADHEHDERLRRQGLDEELREIRNVRPEMPHQRRGTPRWQEWPSPRDYEKSRGRKQTPTRRKESHEEGIRD